MNLHRATDRYPLTGWLSGFVLEAGDIDWRELGAMVACYAIVWVPIVAYMIWSSR